MEFVFVVPVGFSVTTHQISIIDSKDTDFFYEVWFASDLASKVCSSIAVFFLLLSYLVTYSIPQM